jgi:hypothetical protein
MARSVMETVDGIEDTLPTTRQVDQYDPEKGNNLKDPDGAGAPELAEVQELRYSPSDRIACLDYH